MKPDNIHDVTDYIDDIKVEMAYATTNNFTGSIVPGYTENIAFLTIQAIKKLQDVQEELKTLGLGIKILDAYRPKRSVEYFSNDWKTMKTDPSIKDRFFPELEKADLFEIGYIATRSTHSRGSTLDLTLIDLETHKALDMGTEFDFFGDLSHTMNARITEVAQKNRLILKEKMEAASFINYQNEWWHFRLDNEVYPDTYFDFTIKKYF